jgi:hypothetical protein
MLVMMTYKQTLSTNSKSVYIFCTPIDPIKSIDKLEYNMMNYDSIFYWSHRNNILGKHHTHVSIGIAYDKYSFVFVQNFENNYVEFDRPLTEVNNPAYKMDKSNDSEANIEISGKVVGSILMVLFQSMFTMR